MINLDKIHLNQLELLLDKFIYHEDYAEHFSNFDLSDKTDTWKRLKDLSEKQYKYILFLILNNKWLTAKEILNKFLKTKV